MFLVSMSILIDKFDKKIYFKDDLKKYIKKNIKKKTIIFDDF